MANAETHVQRGADDLGHAAPLRSGGPVSTGLHRLVVCLGGVAAALALNVTRPALAAQAPAAATQSIDLAARLAARTVRGVNRTVTRLEGARPGVHLGE